MEQPGRRVLPGCDQRGSICKDARSARDHADRDLAEELSRVQKADRPAARAGSARDRHNGVLAHEPRLKSESRDRL